MLGPASSRRLNAPVTVSLDELVPADNFNRHLETTLDLSVVRTWRQDLSAERGRPSIAPVVVFTRQLIMVGAGSRAEGTLCAMASLHLTHLWYLGYARDESYPIMRA
jgi:hypothetical protein